MLTVRDMAPTDSGPAGLARRCHNCQRRVVWATAYLGRKLAFDPDPIPRYLDYDHTGWIPGRFEVGGKLRTAFAPLPLHPHSKRRRASHVMILHTCPTSRAA